MFLSLYLFYKPKHYAGVLGATWTPLYDIRVDMKAKEAPITLLYRAAIVQDTAEVSNAVLPRIDDQKLTKRRKDWQDVPLTLETATPSFQVGIPTLSTWTLSANHPSSVAYAAAAAVRPPAPQPMYDYAALASLDAVTQEQQRERQQERSERQRDRQRGRASPPLNFRGAAISSKGNVSATFAVPGIITIPSDATTHNVTITELKLDATISWVAVPKLDARVRLSVCARIYLLIEGQTTDPASSG